MPERLSATDALLWRLGHDPALSPITLWLQVHEGALDRQRYERKLEEAVRLVPNLGRRIAGYNWLPRLPRWEDDPSFSLDNHVQYLPAPGDGSMPALVKAIQPMLTQPWGDGRPPWDERVFHGVEGDRTVIVRRQHHVLTDGLRWVRMMEQLVDDSPDGRSAKQRERPEPTKPDKGRPAESVLRGLAHPVATAGRWYGAYRRMVAPLGPRPLSPLMTSRAYTFAFDFMHIDLRALRAGARAAGGSINDGFLAAAATGIRRYHEELGGRSDAIRTTIAIGLGSAEERISGNDITGLIIPMPLAPEPRELVSLIGSRVRDGIGDRDVIRLMTLLPEFASRMPRALVWPIIQRQFRGFDLICSNVRGIRRPYWMAGARHIYTAVTNTPGAAANLIFQRSPESTWLGMCVDTGAIPDFDTFARCIKQGFDEVATLA